MKAEQEVKQKKKCQFNNYQYTGNKLINQLPKPKEKFFQFLNEDIENTDLSDFEFRLLLKLYSMKNGTSINVKSLAKKFNRQERAINENLESLIQKKYIYISENDNSNKKNTNDKELTIRRLSKKSTPIPVNSDKELKITILEFNEARNNLN